MSFHHIYFLSRLFLLICGRLYRAIRRIRILIVGKSENFDSPGAVQMHQKRQADGEAKQPDCAKELDSGKHADQGNHRVKADLASDDLRLDDVADNGDKYVETDQF